MRRWGNYLKNENHLTNKIKAIHIFLSLGDFIQVIELLRETQRLDTAALFFAGKYY